MGILRFIVNYTAVLCYVLGLALIWLDKLRSHPLARLRGTHPAAAAPD